MPRTLFSTRFGLLLIGILCWPISGALAGPIITAASGTFRHGSGDSPGDTRGGLTARLLTAVGQEMSGVTLPVHQSSSGVLGVLPQDLATFSTGIGPVDASGPADAPGAKNTSMSAPVNSSPAVPNPLETRSNSLGRSPERPTVSGDRATPAVANLSIPPGAGQVSGTASSDPVSAVAHPEHRATGTIVPDTAGQGRITPPVGGVSNLNPSSSPLGSTTSSASSTSSIPQSSTTTTVPTNQTAAAVPPQAGSATSAPSAQGAAAPGTGTSPIPNTASFSQAPAFTSTNAGVSPALSPSTAGPMTGSGTSVPQSVTSSTTLPAPAPAIPTAAGSAASVAGQSGQGSALSATGTVNPASSPGNNIGPSLTVGATNPGSPTLTTVTLIAAPGGPDGSSSLLAPASQSAAASLVSLAASPQGTSGGTDGSALPGSASSQINAAVGGTTAFTSSTAATIPLVAPIPLSASSALPPIQASPTVLPTSTPDTTGGNPVSIVLPQNTPEPGTLALFAMVSIAAAIKGAARRVRPRG